MKGSLTYVSQNQKKRPGLEQRHTPNENFLWDRKTVQEASNTQE